MQTSLFFRLSSDCRREKRLSWLCISHRRTLQTNSINTKDRRGDFFVSTFLDFLIEGAVFLNTQTTRALHFHWRPLFCVSLFCTRRQLFIPTLSTSKKYGPPFSTRRQRLLRNVSPIIIPGFINTQPFKGHTKKFPSVNKSHRPFLLPPFSFSLTLCVALFAFGVVVVVVVVVLKVVVVVFVVFFFPEREEPFCAATTLKKGFKSPTTQREGG